MKLKTGKVHDQYHPVHEAGNPRPSPLRVSDDLGANLPLAWIGLRHAHDDTFGTWALFQHAERRAIPKLDVNLA
jgi:hypothetical protein